MSIWLRRLRGLAGMTAIGALAGMLFGVGVDIVDSLGPPSWLDFPMSLYVQVFGIIGASTGLGFGLLVTGVLGRYRLEDVSYRRMSVIGALAGAGVPLLLEIVLGGFPGLGHVEMVVSVGALTGGSVGAGLLAIAKNAEGEQERLPGPDSAQLEAGGTELDGAAG